MEKNNITHKDVQQFYGKAAEKPQVDLCCPVSYPKEDVDHIPQEVLDRFYGCGSPIALANIIEAETVLDLGCGAGIDCFIASKKVGPEGNVIGIDMTDNMLKVANDCKSNVSKKLGFENVDFKKGLLEHIPVEDGSIDIVTSNCVINLSPDKRKVFSEVFRVLKNQGRIVASDIVSDRDLPKDITENKQLWGECLGGAVEENKFISYLEQTGFYGIEVLSKTYWKSIENIDFYSVTVRGYKFEKSPTCVFTGYKAVYIGPFQSNY